MYVCDGMCQVSLYLVSLLGKPLKTKRLTIEIQYVPSEPITPLLCGDHTDRVFRSWYLLAIRQSGSPIGNHFQHRTMLNDGGTHIQEQ